MKYLRPAVCAVLTFVLKTIPRAWREVRDPRGVVDYALAERLRRREYD